MKDTCVQSEGWLLVFMLTFALSFPGDAAENPATMTVRETGSYLYARQDVETHKIAPLQKGETLTLLAEAVGVTTWYMVKTEQGLIGWVRAGDVDLSGQLEGRFREEQVSTWNARAGNGRIYGGTWTLEPNVSPTSASGTWTLRTDAGLVILRGSWSADKFSTGWHGTWQATAQDGQKTYSGSWSAYFPDGREDRFADLFAAAAQQAVRGIWTGGAQSGSWLIRSAK